MENYVHQLLKDADLSVVTKKHVRNKYKEHVGRELNHEEKTKINAMVYAFVKELSAASSETGIEIEAIENTPVSNEESPGNKENKQSNKKANTFIIKGQVVDRNDLFKSSSKKKNDKSPREKDKPKLNESKTKGDSPELTKDITSKQKAAAAKLKINEVMSAVLGPDNGESSSEVSDVSSLTDTSLSEDEEPESGKHLDEALAKLQEARNKKIQMSIEKKNKTGTKEKVKTKSKARRSLAMDKSGSKNKKSEMGEESDDFNHFSDLKSTGNDKTENRLTGNHSNKRKKLESNSDSGELTLNKTPQKYSNNQKNISDKKSDNGSEKKKKIVKKKRRKIKDETSSESDMSDEDDDDFQKSGEKRKNLRQKRTSIKNKRVKEKSESESESDSEDETLDKIAAKKNLSAKPDKEKLDKSESEIKKKRNTKGNDIRKSKKHSENTKKDGIDSDASTGDTPLIKKKRAIAKSDEILTNDVASTPKVKKKIKKNSEKIKEVDVDSDASTGDTPLIKKKRAIAKTDEISTNDVASTPKVKKKIKKNSEKTKEVDVDSDASTGDTPLTKKRAIAKTDEISTNDVASTPKVKKKIKKNSEKTKEVDVDSDASTGDTPLIKKKRVKAKTDEDSAKDETHTPLMKKKIKNHTDITEEVGVESDASTGDTPLMKKKKRVKAKVNEDLEKDGDTPVVRKKKMKKAALLDSDSESKPVYTPSSSKKNSENNAKNSRTDNDSDNDKEISHDSIDGDIEEKPSAKDGKKKCIKNSVISGKRKRKLSDRSNASFSGSPIIRKSKKQKLEETPGKENESDSEHSDVGDTSVVKRTLRNTKVKSDEHDSENKSSEKMECEPSDFNTSKNNVDDKSENPLDIENCDNTTDIDSPIKVVKSRGKVKKKLDSSSEESEEESPIKKPSKKKKSNQKKVPRGKAVNGASSQSEANSTKVSDNSDVDSDSSDDLPLAQIKNVSKTRVSDLSSDSEDDIPLSKTKAAQSKEAVTAKTNKSKNQEENVPTSDMAYLRLLRQICRECQMFVRNDRELAGCDTDKKKIDKLEQMLRDVGMKGKPSMKKAEEVRLMKEAKELSADNIISSETGRVMRKVKSIWARRTISPVKPVKPAHENPFVGLKDIVDSEGEDSG